MKGPPQGETCQYSSQSLVRADRFFKSIATEGCDSKFPRTSLFGVADKSEHLWSDPLCGAQDEAAAAQEVQAQEAAATTIQAHARPLPSQCPASAMISQTARRGKVFAIQEGTRRGRALRPRLAPGCT